MAGKGSIFLTFQNKADAMNIEPLKKRLERQGYVLNGYVSMASPYSAELYALQGWDAVTIDMEHGSIGFDSAVAILQAVKASGVVPMVRIPAVDPAMIGMLLDAGAMGITCAMINTAKDASDLVSACQYPPHGQRSLSRLSRAALVYGPSYNLSANENINIYAMVETKTGMDNLNAIAAVPGLNGIYFGSVDYAMSVRGEFPPMGGGNPEVQALIDQATTAIAQACRENELVAGMNATSPQAAGALMEHGFRFITLSSDARAMMVQSKTWVDETRALARGIG